MWFTLAYQDNNEKLRLFDKIKRITEIEKYRVLYSIEELKKSSMEYC